MKVKVSANTFGTHTHQLFAGLHILKNIGVINLEYAKPPLWFKKRTTRQSTYLECQNDSGELKKIFYDFNDSDAIANYSALEQCDFYFKRSYSGAGYKAVPQYEKIFPFGFNYQIHSLSIKDLLLRSSGDFFFHPYNPLSSYGKGQVSEVVRFWRDLVFKSYPRREVLSSEEISSFPNFPSKRNGVLFQCRLWDPSYFPAKEADHLNNLNKIRINIIQKLKKEFGSAYFGGLQNNPYAQKIAPQLIVQSLTNRKNYIDSVKSAALVVTTNGISESIGWKMGEFVALSKPIICEPLMHKVPGAFEKNRHYLEFVSEDSCLESCVKLIENPSVATSLSENCYSYYHRYLRPDVLVLNSLMRN